MGRADCDRTRCIGVRLVGDGECGTGPGGGRGSLCVRLVADGEEWDGLTGPGGGRGAVAVPSGAREVEEVAAGRQEEEAAAMTEVTLWAQLQQTDR